MLLLLLFCPSQIAFSSPSSCLTLAAVGDVMVGSDYPWEYLPPEKGCRLFDEVTPFFRQADLVFGNHEGTIIDGGTPAKVAVDGRAYVFRTPLDYAGILGAAGFHSLSLANNHSMDWGFEGCQSSQQALWSQGIQTSSKLGEIGHHQINGLRVLMVAYSFGGGLRSILDQPACVAEVRELATLCDVLIVSVHNGKEGGGATRVRDQVEMFLNEPRGNVVSFAHQAIDAGAAIVIGHGPHVPRGMELRNGHLIAYSLGNFCTYGTFRLQGDNSLAPLLMADIAPDGRLISGRIVSYTQRKPGGPTFDPSGQAALRLRELSRLDFPKTAPQFGTDGSFTP